MRLIDIIDNIKGAANASGLFTEVTLVKSDRDIDKVINDANFRSLLITIDSASLLSEDDAFAIQLMTIDKVVNEEYSDDSYIHSVNDSVAALRLILDRLNYNAEYDGNGNGVVKLSGVKFTSGVYSNELITMTEATLSYSFSALPNIDI
jgi:hypothetical protein